MGQEVGQEVSTNCLKVKRHRERGEDMVALEVPERGPLGSMHRGQGQQGHLNEQFCSRQSFCRSLKPKENHQNGSLFRLLNFAAVRLTDDSIVSQSPKYCFKSIFY